MPSRASFIIAALVIACPVLAGCGAPTSAGAPTTPPQATTTVAASTRTSTAAATRTAATVTRTTSRAPASGSDVRPSACGPANNSGVVTVADASAGHRHYRVSLTAAPGYDPCTLAGAPTEVTFRSPSGTPLPVTVTAQTGSSSPVTFGPGHPVHFDIQVPNSPGATPAIGVVFMLEAPGGDIPGLQDVSGSMQVAPGTQAGPVQPG